MSMRRQAAPEKSSSGRGFRRIIDSVAGLVSKVLMGAQRQSTGSGHLGQQRALRLSALFAPRNRLRVSAIAGGVIIAGVALGALLNREIETLPLDNAIWLDRAWIYGDASDAQMTEFAARMVANRIGTAYVYVSSLGIDNRWSGGPQGTDGFMNSRVKVAQFAQAFKSKNEALNLLAWLEIWTHLDNVDGYRLDDNNLHQNIADFSQLLVNQMGFDGVLLDVKPMYTGNDDFIRLVRRVRSALGSEHTIAVAATADLTPRDLRLQDIPTIAPGTMWSPSFKQRVMVLADEVVLLMYQSYRQERLDYVNWIAYHVENYIKLLEANTDILVSIPNYGGASSAHNPDIETMAAAIDGVSEGLRRLSEPERALLTGLAIYSDEQLSEANWTLFREQWLQR